jgi:tRNA(Ile2) C34 agmatinyltransferase TiaS
MSDEVTPGPMCSKCGQKPAGKGGILCPDCMKRIKARRLPEV